MIDILNVLDTRDNYNLYRDIVYKYNTDNDIKRIIDNIDTYYRNTTEDNIQWKRFSTYFFIKNPLIKETKKKLFEAMFEKLDVAPSTTLRETLVDILLERNYAEKIAASAMDVAEGKPGKSLETVADHLRAYEAASGKVTHSIMDSVCTESLEELLKETAPGTGLQWRLTCLNESLGELHNRFVMIAGRPESGKTTLACSECTYMATQLEEGRRVAYFSNEEHVDALKPRLIQSLLGVTRYNLESDPVYWWNEYVARLGGDKDKILVVRKADFGIRDVERMVEEQDIGLIVIDQLRKMRGYDDLKGISRTEALFNWGREMSITHCPIIAIGQLGDDAKNAAYPDMSSIYESRTAIQGELDALITLGQVAGSVPDDMRYIGFPKNKMPRPEVPSLRHGRHEVIILPEIGSFK